MKKIYYFPIGLILLLLITNPSLKAFKEHTGVASSYLESKIFASRLHNYFICSTYQLGVQGSDGYYFAIAGNFFYVKSEREKAEEYLKIVFNRLTTKSDLGTFDEFKAHLIDKAFRLKVYSDAVIQMNLDDYNEFDKYSKLVNN
ncbi:MAG: hypothetical protein JKY70_14845 [Mucilaginibacter sp.]|nr:hypothetical protein [Mucilaginibacter sp.]